MLTFVTKVTFELHPGVSLLASSQEPIHEQDVHWDNEPARSLYAASDLVPLKPRADVVVVGSVFAPEGRALRAVFARLVVGDIDKMIEVHQDRTLDADGKMLRGERFTRMPLSYELAAGGPDTENPAGVRLDVRDAHGNLKLPNIQPSGVDITAPGAEIAPVGFGPIPPTWPERSRKLGHHAATWSPGFLTAGPLPEDLDWSFFNSAPADQQLAVLPAEVRLLLENLHPQVPRLVTMFPPLRLGATLEGRGGAHPLETRCDTLWIDTDRSIACLSFRGEIQLERLDEEGRIVIAFQEGTEDRVTMLLSQEEGADPGPPRPSESSLTGLEYLEQDEEEEEEEQRLTRGVMTVPPPPMGPDSTLAGRDFVPAAALPFAVAPAPAVRDEWSLAQTGAGLPFVQTGAWAAVAPPIPAARPSPPELPIPQAPPPRPSSPGSRRGPPPLPPSAPSASNTPMPASGPPPLPLPLPPPLPAPSPTGVSLPASNPPPLPVRIPAPPPPPPAAEAAAAETALSPGLDRSEETKVHVLGQGGQSIGQTAPAIGSSFGQGGQSIGQAAPAIGPGASPIGQPAPAIAQAAPPIAQGGQSIGQAVAAAIAAPVVVTQDATAGVLGASNSAAGAGASTRRELDRTGGFAAPARSSVRATALLDSREALHLIWYSRESVPRICRVPEWREILDEREERAPDDGLDDASPEKDPIEIEDTRDIFEILARGAADDVETLGEQLSAAVHAGGKFVPPLLLLAGDLSFSFDERETLKAMVAVAAPIGGADEGIRNAIREAREFLAATDQLSPGTTSDSYTNRIRDALQRAKKTLASDVVEPQVERALLEGRHYQRRQVLGMNAIRALLHTGTGMSSVRPAPTYLPDELARKLPLFQKFRARLLVELYMQEDQYEQHAAALKVLAIGRVQAMPDRR
jgi:hypothetical protein